jgi:protein involved in polysaccharide export with SLBB domain
VASSKFNITSVAMSGVPKKLDTVDVSINSGVIKARKGNTTPIYLGEDTNVGAADANSYELSPGDSVSADIVGLQALFVTGATPADRLDIFATMP